MTTFSGKEFQISISEGMKHLENWFEHLNEVNAQEFKVKALRVNLWGIKDGGRRELRGCCTWWNTLKNIVKAPTSRRWYKLTDKLGKTYFRDLKDFNFNLVSFIDTKFYIKHFIFNKFGEIWSNIQTNTKLKSIKGDIKPWPYVDGNVREIRILNRLRIGHTHITHNYLMSNPQVAPNCSWCNGVLTVRHLLVDCPGLIRFRNKWQIPDSLVSILGTDVNLPNLISFLKEIDIFYKL